MVWRAFQWEARPEYKISDKGVTWRHFNQARHLTPRLAVRISTPVSARTLSSTKSRTETPLLMQSPKISHLVNFPLLSKPYLLLGFFIVLLKSGSVDFTPKLPHHFTGEEDGVRGNWKWEGEVRVSCQGHLTCPLEGQLRPPPSTGSFTPRKSISKYINISSLTSPNSKISEQCLPFSLSYFMPLLLNAFVTCEAKWFKDSFYNYL